MPSDSDWGRLREADDMHDQQIAELAVAFAQFRERVDLGFERGAERMTRIETSLARNTELTQTVAQIVINFRGIGRAAAWVAKRLKMVSIWIASLVGAVMLVLEAIDKWRGS